MNHEFSYFHFRHQLIIITGVMAFGYMSSAMVLAVRIPFIEKWVKGLDKSYALHKRLGILATISLICHWLIIESAHWFIKLQWVIRPSQGQGLGQMNGKAHQVEGINLHHLGETIGEISFYVFLVFVIVSLAQTIGYKTFRFTHKVAGVIFIAGAIHAFLLLDYNNNEITIIIGTYLMGIIGILSAIWSLSNRIGLSKKVVGNVVSVQHFNDMKTETKVIKIKILLEKEIAYKSGQFAFINFHDGESPHPFSILNYNAKTNEIEFAIKALGDYTEHLTNVLNKRHHVTVEGGYGFFQTENEHFQVWVGAGIGIVPFISRLNELVRPSNKHKNISKIQLYYCTKSEEDAFFKAELLALVDRLPFVDLHCIESDRGSTLKAEYIHLNMPLPSYKVSFCGPQKFGDTLQLKLAELGIRNDSFSREIFSLR